MRTQHIQILLMILLLGGCGQHNSRQVRDEVKFDTLISHFQIDNFYEDTIKLPIIHKSDEYLVELSKNPLSFESKHIVIKNPIDDKYPLSYSVLFKDKLVSLFEPGVFVCHTIPLLKRDLDFEKKLNTMNFQYHWILDNKLIGYSNKHYYYLDNQNNWTTYNEPVPLVNQPKLFEDRDFISFCDCQGEFGGTVYFYNKQTKKTHFTEATCANTVIKKDNKYFILSELGHMIGSTKLKEVSNPNLLPLIDLAKSGNLYKGQALGYADTTNVSKSIFRFDEVQMFSLFNYQGRTIYLVYWNKQTFLAEIEGRSIRIINPLFNSDIYTHNSMTTNYDNTILINLDFYGVAREREVSCIIIKDDKLVKLDWNEKHSR